MSRSTSLGGVIQQLTISLGVSVSAMLLALLSQGRSLPSVADFHHAFLLMALVTLISSPGFLLLRPGTAAHVSGQRRTQAATSLRPAG